MSATRRIRSARRGKQGVGRRGAGRTVALAALLLVVGLVLGGVAGLKLADQPVVQRVLNRATKAPRAATPVTVEKQTTPASCVTALDTLTGALASLNGARDKLMEADIARVSGNQSTAGRAYAEVDRALRSAEVETKDPLRVAVEDCKSKAPVAAQAPATTATSSVPTQTATREFQAAMV
jgi:hypothetical protein